jgi:RNA polymerase sigma-70 factor (ECF subfamily)
MDDRALMERISQGDHAAFSTLVKQHAPALDRFAVRLLLQHQQAEEVVQETFMRVWQRAGDYDAKRARLSTWLHQIAHNLCIDILRRRKRELPLVNDVEDVLISPDATESPTTAREAQDQVAAAIAKLNEHHRTGLVLTYYQGLSNREVAQIMDLSVRALESLLVRARQQIKKILEESS